MRACLALILAACGSSSTTKPPLTLTTSFAVTQFLGNGPSPLDPLQDQTIAMTVVIDDVNVADGDPASEPAGCKTRTIYDDIARRTATGSSADLVQTQILDMLPDWDVTMQICGTASSSSLLIVATIDPLNLSFGCPLPAGAQVTDANGYPELTSFTATGCTATILDVSNNRTLGNTDFPVTLQTATSSLP